MKMTVGNNDASERPISGPVRKGPVSSARSSMTFICFLSSCNASRLHWKAPYGGAARYMQDCRDPMYMSWTLIEEHMEFDIYEKTKGKGDPFDGEWPQTRHHQARNLFLVLLVLCIVWQMKF